MCQQVTASQGTLSPYENNMLLISLNSLAKKWLAEMKKLLEHSVGSIGVRYREQWRESIAERRKANRTQQFCMQRNCSLLNELWANTQQRRHQSTIVNSNWWSELNRPNIRARSSSIVFVGKSFNTTSGMLCTKVSLLIPLLSKYRISRPLVTRPTTKGASHTKANKGLDHAIGFKVVFVSVAATSTEP
uniref:Uncharacterized protein n=1 Tax=Glossina palpalis gambiensis TaxID=67801 RepID=A0A1B0AZS9_9MUSC